MVYNSAEMNYLLSLLKAVLNNEVTGEKGRSHDWGLIFSMSAYHKVQAMVCYALLFHEPMSQEWRERYSARFRELVTEAASYKKEAQAILELLDREGIPSLLLPPEDVKALYPQEDMRELEGLSLLVREDKKGLLFSAMNGAGLRYEGETLLGSHRFVTAGGTHVAVYFRLFCCDKKFGKLFARLWDRLGRTEGEGSRYRPGPEDEYLLLVCWSAVRFSFSQADIRDVADLYLYLRKWGEGLNWTYIDEKLAECDVLDFAKALRALAWLWFAKTAKETKGSECLDMEEYILSKGMYAKEPCMKLLPMMARLEIWKLKKERRARLQAVVRWLFPQGRYMAGLYPVLERYPWLLGYCWLRRLIRLPFRRIRLGLERVGHRLYFLVSPWLDRILFLWEKRGRAAKEDDRERKGKEKSSPSRK